MTFFRIASIFNLLAVGFLGEMQRRLMQFDEMGQRVVDKSEAGALGPPCE